MPQGMSPPPLGISQSLKNSLISLKDEKLALYSALRSLKLKNSLIPLYSLSALVLGLAVDAR